MGTVKQLLLWTFLCGQRIGRIHLLGQKLPIDVYNLVSQQIAYLASSGRVTLRIVARTTVSKPSFIGL